MLGLKKIAQRKGEKSVALYVDGPNLLRKELNTDLETLRNTVKKYGRLVVAKVFLNQFPPQKMIEAAQKIGLGSYQKENMTIEEVKKIIRSGSPVIANFQLKPQKGEGHYAVMIGYSQNTFVLSDPQEEHGYREVKIKDFMKLWYELEDQTVRQGIVLKPQKGIVIGEK